MSTRDRGRHQSFRFRLLGWASTSSAPQRGPPQRQPSRVTTTVAQPQSPAPQDQPSLPPQPGQQLPLSSPAAQVGAPSRRRSQRAPSSPSKAQMGTAPSKSASETHPPGTQAAPTQATARAPPSSPSDAAPPWSQPAERPSQPTSRTLSRQLSRTYTQPPSPSRPPSQPQATAPRGPAPSPPSLTAFPAQPASPAEPKVPSATPSQPPTPPPAASRPSSPPAKATPSPSQPASEQEIPKAPTLSPAPATTPVSPATKVLQLEPPPTEQKGPVETTTAPAKLQPQEASQEEDQTPIDSAFMPIEVESRAVPETGDKPMPIERPPIPLPAPETQPDKTQDQLPPKKRMDQKQKDDTTEPPKPEPEPEPEPEEIEEQKPVITIEVDQKSDPRLSQDIERKLEGTEEEKIPANQQELDKESDPDRSKTIETKPEGKPQTKDSQKTPNMVETKQTSQEPHQKPTQLHVQPITEVKVSEAERPEKQTPPPEKEPAPPGSTTKGKEGKIAISTVARTSTSSRDQSGSLHKEIKEGISRLVQNLAVEHTKQTGGGQGISIITLAGDNQGASMYVGHGATSREGNNVHVHKGPSPNGGDSAAAGEDGQKKTDQQLSPTTATSTSVNSNVQTINNSILHESCCSEENPGVHLVLSTSPPEPAQPKETATPPQPQKPKTRAPLLQKLTHQPTVRRRCLRALFLESSDDDPENLQKPRRHGCRFSCDDRNKAKGEQDGTARVNTQGRNGREGVDRA